MDGIAQNVVERTAQQFGVGLYSAIFQRTAFHSRAQTLSLKIGIGGGFAHQVCQFNDLGARRGLS